MWWVVGAGVAWLAIAIPVGITIGRMVHRADIEEGTTHV